MATSPARRRLFTGLTKLFTSTHVALYRRTGGKMGGHVSGLPILLLTTTGRKSGQQRTTPLGYLMDGPAYVITASNGGQAYAPAWWLNLQHNPKALIQVGRQVLPVVARQADPDERRRLWAALISRAPSYEGYQKRTTRAIPMVVLRSATSS